MGIIDAIGLVIPHYFVVRNDSALEAEETSILIEDQIVALSCAYHSSTTALPTR